MRAETNQNFEVGQLRRRIIRSYLRDLVALPVGLHGKRVDLCSKWRTNIGANEPIYKPGSL